MQGGTRVFGRMGIHPSIHLSISTLLPIYSIIFFVLGGVPSSLSPPEKKKRKKEMVVPSIT